MAAVNENSREALEVQQKLEAKEEKKQSEEKGERIRLRLIPIWIRVVMVVLLMGLSSLIGAAIGYGVLGTGNAIDVFKPSTWTHIINLVDKE
jgi:hypothetical protein